MVVPLSDGVSPSWAQPEEGDLRVIPLAETDAEYEGRLEIYHEGEWGGICDDYWGIQNVRVACRELGYRSGAATVEVLCELEGPTTAPMWLDSVDCTGTEARLIDCPSRHWGPYNPHECSAR